MRIAALHRYPLKGFSPERLSRVMLETGGHFPADRSYAIENGPSGFDAARPEHLPKIRFLMLMRNEQIARLTTRLDDATGLFSISENGAVVLQADILSADGRAAIARFLEGWMPADSLRGPLRVLAAPQGSPFMDSRSGFVSLINAASVGDLAQRLGAAVDPLRFRGNILLDGLQPWQEFDLVGKALVAPSGLRLKVLKRTERCAATAVDPSSGARDLPVVRTLMKELGHADCGIYAEITEGGTLSEGQHLTLADAVMPVGRGLWQT